MNTVSMAKVVPNEIVRFKIRSDNFHPVNDGPSNPASGGGVSDLGFSLQQVFFPGAFEEQIKTR